MTAQMNRRARKPFASVSQRVEYRQLPASRGAAHDVCCLATQPCHQRTPFYQSRLTQTQLIISFQAVCECRTLTATLQLYIRTLNAMHFVGNKYVVTLYRKVKCNMDPCMHVDAKVWLIQWPRTLTVNKVRCT